MRAIDADRLLEERRIHTYYHLPNGDIAIPLIDIKNAPTIEERKKGKWIKEDQYINRWGDTVEILRCPICEFKHNYTQGDTSHSDDGWFDFCPYCGSDMREGDQDD